MNVVSTLLVVDDDEAGRRVKVRTLQRAGFDVVEAATGAEALALVSSRRPDLIVMEVNLPDISGLEVARRLRAGPRTFPAIQILQISDTAIAVNDQIHGLEQGADVFLTEPVDGQVLVATVQSLLRMRRAEAALAAALDGERRAREVAEAASGLKDEFIATLSHELRTPLNAVMGWIWQLRHHTLDAASQERALESLERNTRLQAQLINDLLDISRASKGRLQLEVRVVALERVVADAIASIADTVEERHLDLHPRLDSVQVVGDPSRLQQIVANLLTNAVQFTPVGGRVSVTLAPIGNDALLTVEDTGAGIDPAFLPYVFDQFRQGERGLISKHGGLGLGLAVVRQLVELHSGSVVVTSAGLGCGATFSVRLPREMGNGLGSRAESPRLLDAIRVRLIADDGIDPAAVKAILESSGAEVTMASLDVDDGGPLDHVDLVARQVVDGGPIALRRAERNADWQTIPGSSRPVDMVRRMARLAANGHL